MKQTPWRIHVIVCVVAAAVTCSGWAGELRAGASALAITPPLGIEINGGTSPRIADFVHDELYARALVLDDGKTRLAFVVVDNCLIDRAVFDEAKALAVKHTKIPPENICMSATHTHSAGSVTGAHLSEADPAYRAWLPQKLADAVRVAAANLAPARAAWGKGSVPQHVFCRRITIKPGVSYKNLLGNTGDQVKMNWSSPDPAVDGDFSSPVDTELSVLSVQHADGRPLSLLANYSLHYVGGVPGGHLSADYFGVYCSRIAELLNAEKGSPKFVAMLSNGTSGDINNIDYRLPRAKQPPYEQIQRVADDVARETLRVLEKLEYRTAITLACAHAEVELAVRKPTAEDLERARKIVEGKQRTQLRTWTEFYAREQIILSEYPGTLSVPLQVFRVGDLAIAQWPGEIFAVSGLRLKELSPIKPLFNISLANGWFGYIPPPEQHAMGSYETWRGRTSPLETGAIPKITDAFVKLLEQLR